MSTLLICTTQMAICFITINSTVLCTFPIITPTTLPRENKITLLCPWETCGHAMACPYVTGLNARARILRACGHAMAGPYVTDINAGARILCACGHAMACPYVTGINARACILRACGHAMACPYAFLPILLYFCVFCLFILFYFCSFYCWLLQ